MSASSGVASPSAGARASRGAGEALSARVPNEAPDACVLEARGLTHAFGETRVLDGFGFGLRAGEMLGLLGPNGCGKSTTLRVLTGMLIPDAGELWWRGERVTPGDRKLRAAMGVVFQTPSLDARLSARENLSLAASLYGYSGREARVRAAEALAFAELEARASESVATLSGGMRRRLELARALLHEPELLLLDEPTTGLDEVSFQRAWERIATLRARLGSSVILATHRAEEAALCDRVAVLDRGRLVACDTPRALIDRVSGDVLTLEVDDPELRAGELRARFGLEVRTIDGALVLERERGHELVPRLVEALPTGSIRSLSMRRPDLADVFVKLTGHSLGRDGQQP